MYMYPLRNIDWISQQENSEVTGSTWGNSNAAAICASLPKLSLETNVSEVFSSSESDMSEIRGISARMTNFMTEFPKDMTDALKYIARAQAKRNPGRHAMVCFVFAKEAERRMACFKASSPTNDLEMILKSNNEVDELMNKGMIQDKDWRTVKLPESIKQDLLSMLIFEQEKTRYPKFIDRYIDSWQNGSIKSLGLRYCGAILEGTPIKLFNQSIAKIYNWIKTS
jgi:hypothetical protein